ncbi:MULTISPECIES: hypothetical protein [Sphingobacterium]|uniref:5-bromo-4-chloroindolyl phosphate hydrolysis protein n=1 Tax=Sphingobacterium cellulitidis TaxID=1768011 RepID=A0A8H9KUT6_9SPHI|nr:MULTISPECIES: hypothetical protein [Sphingobacterium]MBA8987270.1 hypothetical protein [Sphingobacterium soli]OYD40641.1 hypothetical protein CHT99_18045 [Sphingobacterium cellulitidis]OYD44099.1 hypothetical protein CHU00_18710 [Sphingobacterium cellulitidis]WFB62998.1 hypothetical protein PZ892_15155 [Sphingobacterium sp. WM]GGE31505.1 hypothetical protein GCM10011516_31520 [Sphingobacterium soli]
MGWATKKSRPWEVKQLVWTFLSILMFLPLPIHVHPLVMMSQAKKAKVRSWMVTAWLLLAIEIGLLVSFVVFFGTLSQAMLLTLGGSVLSYVVGNAILLNQVKPYLQRLELAEVRDLYWISNVNSQKRLELAAPTIDTPQLFVERLLHWRKEIDNNNIHKDIDKILRLFQLLEKKDKREAEKFLVRHSTIVNVLMQYDELENANLNNSVTYESKRKLEDVIRQAAVAVEQEVTNQFKMGMLDVSAETDVYIQTLKSRNLLKE